MVTVELYLGCTNCVVSVLFEKEKKKNIFIYFHFSSSFSWSMDCRKVLHLVIKRMVDRRSSKPLARTLVVGLQCHIYYSIAQLNCHHCISSRHRQLFNTVSCLFLRSGSPQRWREAHLQRALVTGRLDLFALSQSNPGKLFDNARNVQV